MPVGSFAPVGGGGVGVEVTVSVAAPVMPSLVALMLAVPAPTADTAPVDELTVATAVLEELHVTVRPVRIRPSRSRNVDVAVVVPPTGSDDEPNETRIDATGAGSIDPVVIVRLR